MIDRHGYTEAEMKARRDADGAVITRQSARIAALEAENARLRGLVEAAYTEGWSAAGVPGSLGWKGSDARAALDARHD